MKKTTIIFLILSIVIAGIVSWYFYGSSFKKEKRIKTPEVTKICEECNFTLFGMKSSKYEQLRVKIYIDDKIVMDEDFAITKNDKDSPLYRSLSPHHTYKAVLSKGTHKIKATTKENVPVFEGEFDLKDKLWAVIGYEESNGLTNSPKGKFGFWYQENPIYFQ